MAIYLLQEQIIPAPEVPNHIERRGGKKVSRFAVYRWMRNGIQGEKLEHIRLPSGLCTSVQAIQRFADRLTALGRKEQPPLPHTGRTADRCQAQVEQEIDKLRAKIRKPERG